MIDKQLLYDRVQQERQKLVDTMMEFYAPSNKWSCEMNERRARRIEEYRNGDLHYGYLLSPLGDSYECVWVNNPDDPSMSPTFLSTILMCDVGQGQLMRAYKLYLMADYGMSDHEIIMAALAE